MGTALIGGLERFFEAPNELPLADLDAETRDLLDAVVDRWQTGRRTVLPAVVDGQTRWYGVAPDAQSGRLLIEEMRAWLGPPFAEDPRIISTPADELDAAAADLTGDGVAIRVDIPNSSRRRSRQDVRTLLRTWDTRPPRHQEAVRPVGRVLREFYEAVGANNEPAATDLFNELRNGSLLTPRNALFLQVRLLHGFGRYEEMLASAMVSRLRNLERPPLVTQLLAHAFNESRIEPLLVGSNTVVLDSLAATLQETFAGLIEMPRQAVDSATARCLALQEFSKGDLRQEVRLALQEWSDDPVVRAVIEHLGAPVVVLPALPEVQDQTAGDLWRTDQHDELLQLIEDTLGDDAIQFGVAAAVDLRDPDYTRRVLAALESMPTDARAALDAQAGFSRRLGVLVEMRADEGMPSGWIEWLTEDWPDRPDRLDEASSRWEWAGIDQDEFALELLEGLQGPRRDRIRNGLPIVVRTVLEHSALRGSVALAINLAVVLSDNPLDSSERVLLLDLVEEVLRSGCTVAQYVETLAAVERVVESVGSAAAEWVAQVVETLFVETCPSPGERNRLLATVQGKVAGWRQLVDRPEWLAIDVALRIGDFGLESWAQPQTATTTDRSVEAKAPRRVLIYSLLDGAAQRAADWIMRECPNWEVLRSSAKVGSAQLEAQAAHSDLVIVHTSHAKHPASNAIEAAMPSVERLVRVHGRGATSLFRAFVERLDQDDFS